MSISVSLLAACQPISGGINLVVTSEHTSPVVSYQYYVYPGDNANSSNAQANYIYNRTVNVGSPKSALADASGGKRTYSLFVETTQLFPEYDYYIVVLALFADGSISEYSTAQLLPLTPGRTVLADTDVTLTRDPSSYATNATITVKFSKITVPIGSASSTITYNLGIQYKSNDLQNTKFIVAPGLGYENDLGGVKYVLMDPEGIDEAWVAIQSVRTLGDGTQATSELSNTVFANDTDIPLPPRDLQGTYNYADDIPNVVLTWLPSFYEQIGNIKGYIIYRTDLSGNYVELISIPQRTTQINLNEIYTYTDNSLAGYPGGSIISYIVKTEETNGNLSIPSNAVSFTVLIPNSAPRNLDAIGIADIETATQDVTISFRNPLDVYGLPVFAYQQAYFEVSMFNSNSTSNVLIKQTTDTIYDATNAGFYIVNFNNQPFTGINNLQSVKITVRLITYQTNGNELLGKTAIQTISVGPRPLFLPLNVNDELTWDNYTGLAGYRIITPTTLLPNGNTILTANKITQEVGLDILNITPTTRTDPYLPFFQCLEYQVTSTNIPDQNVNVVIELAAANQYGLSQLMIQGPLFL